MNDGKKEDVLEILDELQDEIQAMREENECDLDEIYMYVRNAVYKIREL